MNRQLKKTPQVSSVFKLSEHATEKTTIFSTNKKIDKPVTSVAFGPFLSIFLSRSA